MPCNLFGQNDNYDSLNSHVLAALIKKIVLAKKQNKKSFIVWGTGKPKREFLHVDDLSSAIEFVLKNNVNYELLNVGSGEEIQIVDLAHLLKEIIDFEGEITNDTNLPDGNPRKLIDSSKINQLGWSAKIPLKEGLQNTYEWFLNNFENIRN